MPSSYYKGGGSTAASVEVKTMSMLAAASTSEIQGDQETYPPLEDEGTTEVTTSVYKYLPLRFSGESIKPSGLSRSAFYTIE
ncbi:hypothetical protein AAAC51_07700 [Priestia megaterium]